jgi:hypothetical protein
MRSDDGFDEIQDGLDPQLCRWLRAACRVEVDVETAAAHLWRIHHEANTAPLLLPDVLVERAARIAGTAGPAEVHGTPATRGEPPVTGSDPQPQSMDKMGRRPRRSLVAVLSAVFMFATSGIAVAASGGALPGEMLYPVKLGAERAQLVLTLSPAKDAHLHLRFAQKRLEEASAVLASRPESVPRLLIAAADAADHAERLAGPDVSEGVAEVRQATGTALTSVVSVVDPADAAELGVLADRLGMPTLALSGEPRDPGTPARTPLAEDALPTSPPVARMTEDPPLRAAEAFPRPAPDPESTADAAPTESPAAPAPATERPQPSRPAAGGTTSVPSASPDPAPDPQPSSDEQGEEPSSGESPPAEDADSEGGQGESAASEDPPPSEEPAADEEGAKHMPGMDELAQRFEDR